MWCSLICLHQAKPQDTLDLCQFLNNDLAATVARHPRRFVGLGTLPMQAPELAVKEMERCVKELGFPGVQIGSHVNTWDLNAQELFPVYAVSVRADGAPCWALGLGTVLGTEAGHWLGAGVRHRAGCWREEDKCATSLGGGERDAADMLGHRRKRGKSSHKKWPFHWERGEWKCTLS